LDRRCTRALPVPDGGAVVDDAGHQQRRGTLSARTSGSRHACHPRCLQGGPSWRDPGPWEFEARRMRMDRGLTAILAGGITPAKCVQFYMLQSMPSHYYYRRHAAVSSSDAPPLPSGSSPNNLPATCACAYPLSHEQSSNPQPPGAQRYRTRLILLGGCFVHAGQSQSPTGSSLMPTHSQWNH
jgi:hypothetical protein